MDNTLQEIITLVEKGKVEQRCAALLVLGALKITNAAVVKAVGALLNDPNPVLKDYALRYFEEVQPKNNVAQLVRMLDDDDRELQERAVRSLGGAGQAGVEPVMGFCTPERTFVRSATFYVCESFWHGYPPVRRSARGGSRTRNLGGTNPPLCPIELLGQLAYYTTSEIRWKALWPGYYNRQGIAVLL